MKLLFPLLFIVFVSCSKPSDQAGSPAPAPSELALKLAKGAAGGVAGALSCTHPDAIEADLAVELAKLPLLSQKSLVDGQKGLGADLCIPAVSIVLPMLIGTGLNQIPSSWGCSGSAAGSGLSSIAKLACQFIPF